MGEGTTLIVEDIDRAGYDEKALFHLLNLAREKRLFVLLYGARDAPSRFDCALPDLSVAAECACRRCVSAPRTTRCSRL